MDEYLLIIFLKYYNLQISVIKWGDADSDMSIVAGEKIIINNVRTKRFNGQTQLNMTTTTTITKDD